MRIKPWISWEGKDIVCGILSRILWPRNSAAALVFNEEKLLAIDTGSYLMLPGGALEYGEHFEEATVRETLEETGYEIEIERKLSERINSVGGVEKIFSATLELDEPVSGGNWEGKPIWVSIEKAGERQWRHNRDIESFIDRCRKQS